MYGRKRFFRAVFRSSTRSHQRNLQPVLFIAAVLPMGHRRRRGLPLYARNIRSTYRRYHRGRLPVSCPCGKGLNQTPCGNLLTCNLCLKYHCQEKWNKAWGGDGTLLPDCPEKSPLQPPGVLALSRPTVAQRLANAGNAVGRAVQAAIGGNRGTVPRAVQEVRLGICMQCPSQQWDGAVCKVCGCVGKFKAWLATEDCPLGHWPKITEPKG